MVDIVDERIVVGFVVSRVELVAERLDPGVGAGPHRNFFFFGHLVRFDSRQLGDRRAHRMDAQMGRALLRVRGRNVSVVHILAAVGVQQTEQASVHL